MSIDVNELIRSARHGDAEAFGELYSIYSNEMYRYACIVVGNPDAAQDAVSDAVLEAFKGIKTLRSEDSFKGWLFKILNSACRRHYNEFNRNLQLSEDLDIGSPDGGGIDNLELSIGLEQAMLCLSAEERQIVMMKAVHGYGSHEISLALGLNDSTVRSKLKRALEKLRNELQKGGGYNE